jgi:hypothetical protein
MAPRSLFTFKALVLDKHGLETIAPVMKVGSLRDCNIVLHLNISQKRERIPDLPVIYFVEPTEPNFKQIAQDASKSLYDYIIVNFSTPLATTQLDLFA